MKTIKQLATDCANHFLGRIEFHTDRFETLRKVFIKGYEQAGGDYATGCQFQACRHEIPQTQSQPDL